MNGGLKARFHPGDPEGGWACRAYSPPVPLLHLQPRPLAWAFSLCAFGAPGRVQPPITANRSTPVHPGHSPICASCGQPVPPPDLPIPIRLHRSLFSALPFPTEGQRPGLISAYGTAIGIGHQDEWRAESPVSSAGIRAGTDESGLQPLD